MDIVSVIKLKLMLFASLLPVLTGCVSNPGSNDSKATKLIGEQEVKFAKVLRPGRYVASVVTSSFMNNATRNREVNRFKMFPSFLSDVY